MENKKHIIIFSHGFGVRKDSRGFFTYISTSIPEAEFVFFDYNIIDEENKTITLSPISEQVEKLKGVIKEIQESNRGAIIDLICHSQGTIVAALACPEGIRKTILLAPVFNTDITESILNRYVSHSKAIVNPNGVSVLPSSDGYNRLVSREFIRELSKIKPFDSYNTFCEKTELIIIEAMHDELLAKVDMNKLNPKVILLSVDGDHNFKEEARINLVKTLRYYLL